MPAADIGHRMSPILHDNARPHVPQPMLQKLNELGHELLPHLLYWPDLSPTDYHFKHLDNFFQEKCFHDQQNAENAFQKFIEAQSTDFYATGINIFLVSKNVLIIIVLILINKNVFEPSYDLKSMVWNHNYLFTNLTSH